MHSEVTVHLASNQEFRIDLKSAEPMDHEAGRRWLDEQDDTQAARLALASFGDDYELACAIPEARVDTFLADIRKTGVDATVVGRFSAGSSFSVAMDGSVVEPGAGGFTHF